MPYSGHSEPPFDMLFDAICQDDLAIECGQCCADMRIGDSGNFECPECGDYMTVEEWLEPDI